MARTPVSDVVVLLPGITGSVLQKDGRDVWAVTGSAAVEALKSLGRDITSLELHGDDAALDDLGDGITAPRVIPDVHLIPGLWKIDGYGKVSATIREQFDVTPGLNFFEFPYDWRRDNRVHARRLARESHEWLAAWRAHSGNEDAKLILIELPVEDHVTVAVKNADVCRVGHRDEPHSKRHRDWLGGSEAGRAGGAQAQAFAGRLHLALSL